MNIQSYCHSFLKKKKKKFSVNKNIFLVFFKNLQCLKYFCLVLIAVMITFTFEFMVLVRILQWAHLSRCRNHLGFYYFKTTIVNAFYIGNWIRVTIWTIGFICLVILTDLFFCFFKKIDSFIIRFDKCDLRGYRPVNCILKVL